MPRTSDSTYTVDAHVYEGRVWVDYEDLKRFVDKAVELKPDLTLEDLRERLERGIVGDRARLSDE